MSDVTSVRCRNPNCHVPDTPCEYGELEYRNHCPNYVHDDAPGGIDEDRATEFPWTGNTLGLDGYAWVSGPQRPVVIAPVGAHNAGKTTFLVAVYLGLCRGNRLFDYRFAGSYTLGGWENLANYLRYPPQGVGPGFPPHTPPSAKAVPGLLHLAFRRPDGRLIETSIADGPGEWFTNWAVNVDHSGAAGARWVADQADGFILFVDSDALAGGERGVARDSLFMLAQRLEAISDGRTVTILWAKSDITLSSGIRKQVPGRLKDLFPTSRHFETTVRPTKDTDDATTKFVAVLEPFFAPSSDVADVPSLKVSREDDPFLSFRGRKK